MHRPWHDWAPIWVLVAFVSQSLLCTNGNMFRCCKFYVHLSFRYICTDLCVCVGLCIVVFASMLLGFVLPCAAWLFHIGFEGFFISVLYNMLCVGCMRSILQAEPTFWDDAVAESGWQPHFQQQSSGRESISSSAGENSDTIMNHLGQLKMCVDLVWPLITVIDHQKHWTPDECLNNHAWYYVSHSWVWRSCHQNRWESLHLDVWKPSIWTSRVLMNLIFIGISTAPLDEPWWKTLGVSVSMKIKIQTGATKIYKNVLIQLLRLCPYQDLHASWSFWS